MKKSLGAKTIIFPTPVFIVATYDKAGKPNMAAVAWGGICCSKPPCVAISLREATYSYGNIIERKAFTINIPSQDFIRQANYAGMVSGRTEDKFKSCNLTPVKSDVVDAPYVREFPFALECALRETIKLGLHTQFVGEIKDIKADDSVLSQEGYPDIEKIKPFIYNPANQTYYAVGKYLADAFAK